MSDEQTPPLFIIITEIQEKRREGGWNERIAHT